MVHVAEGMVNFISTIWKEDVIISSSIIIVLLYPSVIAILLIHHSFDSLQIFEFLRQCTMIIFSFMLLTWWRQADRMMSPWLHVLLRLQPWAIKYTYNNLLYVINQVSFTHKMYSWWLINVYLSCAVRALIYRIQIRMRSAQNDIQAVIKFRNSFHIWWK